MTLPTDNPAANGGTDTPASGGIDSADGTDATADADAIVDTDASDDAGRPTLHFAYDAAAPSMDAFDVKEIAPGTLLGAPAAFTVVGESHVVSAPALGFHELCSCRPLPADAFSVPLDRGLRREFEVEIGEVRVETEATVTDLDAFLGAGDADVAFRFDPAAWTTIDVADDGYETYHTYPEYDLAVHTATRLVPAAGSIDSTANSAGATADSTGATDSVGPIADSTRPGDGHRCESQENP